MSDFLLQIPSFGSASWRPPVATSSALPASGNTAGDAIVAKDTGTIYIWTGSAWAAAGGGGGSPGGANTDIQFNNSGAFGGSSSLTWTGTHFGVGTGATGFGVVPANDGTSSALIYDLAGNWSINGDGSATFANGLFSFDTLGNLTAGGNISLPEGGITVSGSFSSDNGQISSDGAGDLYVAAQLYVAGSAVIYDGLNVYNGPTNLDSGQISSDGAGDFTVGERLDVGGLANLNNGLNVYNAPTSLDGGSITTTGTGQMTLSLLTTTTLQVNGKLNYYNGVNTAGLGIGYIVSNVALTAQAASISATNFYGGASNAPPGVYRLSGYVECTTAGTAGDTLAIAIGYHDDNGAQTVNPLSLTNLSMSTTGFSAVPPLMIKSAGTNQITYATTLSSTAGSPKYALYLVLERIQ